MQNDVNESIDDGLLDDEFFQNYAKTIKKEQEESRKGSGGSTANYEDITYAGLIPGEYKVLRLIGNPPGSEKQGVKRRNFDPLTSNVIECKGDDGKKFIIKLPPREDLASKNHILYRLYDKVRESIWVNGKKVTLNETKYPELWEAVTKTGYKPSDGQQYTYASGLKPTNLIMYNVIDRHDSWCADNKHTKILAREINVDANGNEWPKAGVKSYGFLNRLAEIIGKSGNPQSFDIGVMKTGQKEEPFKLCDLSVFKKKDFLEQVPNADGTLVDEKLIVVGPLTEEEKKYTTYNLEKLNNPTSYTKIYKRIASVFKLCDADLGTKFVEEITASIEKEKAEWKIKYGSEDEAAEEATAKEESKTIADEVTKAELPEEKPVARRTSVGAPSTGLNTEKIALLKGWGKLTDIQKAMIIDVVVEDGKPVIKWAEDSGELLACNCDALAPETFESCPVCGADFV